MKSGHSRRQVPEEWRSANTVTGAELLKTDYKDSAQFLLLKDLWIGERAEKMLKELG